VDVELPDAGPTTFVPALIEAQRRRGAAGRVVALVRDAADVGIAGAAGITHTLGKPFDRESIETLLGDLGFGSEGR
jgi:hypothetical protein